MSSNKISLNSSERDTLSLSSMQDEAPRTFNIRPQDGANCRIVLETEEPVEFEFPTQQEFDFRMGESESLLGDVIEDNLRKLKVGDECSFVVPANEESTSGQKDRTLTLKLGQIENCIPVYQLPGEEKLEKAKHNKEKGVELFKEGLLEYAFRRFSRALKLLILMLPRENFPDSILKEYETLKVQCYSNLAACQLKQQSYDYVVANCTKALEIEPGNVKCIYRRAEAYLCIKNYELCEKDIAKGLKLEPKSKTFKDLDRKLNDVTQTED